MIKNLFYIIFIIFATSCEEDNKNFISGETPYILFQVDYMNHAWGFQHNGFMIDSSGNVRTYNLPDKWHWPDSLGYISATDMNENISHLSAAGRTINPEVVRSYYDMLGDASRGKLSDPRNTMNDFGGIAYSGYLPVNGKDGYRQVVIWVEGDWTITNSAPEAEKIFTWLKSIFTGQKK